MAALEVVEDEGLEVGEGGRLLYVQVYSTIPVRFQCFTVNGGSVFQQVAGALDGEKQPAKTSCIVPAPQHGPLICHITS